MEIIIIAAMAANRVIGRDNTIPWHIPGEQKRFREVTWGHSLIMGRKTHESIGRALPGRRNIVISRDSEFRAAGCQIARSLEEAYSLCRGDDRVFNIGGEQLYRQGIGHAHILMLTVLHEPVAGDTVFPEISENDFVLIDRKVHQGPVPHSSCIYRRLSAANLPELM